MMLDTFTYFRLFHCGVDNHNKVWGYFLHGAHWWAFWGGVGKSCTFKYHGAHENRSTLTDLALSKMRKGYSEVPISAWDEWDPAWRDKFNERFIYFLLQQPAI